MVGEYEVRLNLGDIRGLTQAQAKDIEKVVKAMTNIRTAEAQLLKLKKEAKKVDEDLATKAAKLSDSQIRKLGQRKKSIQELIDLSKKTGMVSWGGGVTTFQTGSTPAVGKTEEYKKPMRSRVWETAVGFKQGLIDSGFMKGIAEVGAAGIAFGAGIGVFEAMTKNSKILATVMETISRLLGLFMDIIFLPFMPLFIWLIRGIHFLLMGMLKLEKSLGQPLSLAIVGTGAILAALLAGKVVDVSLNLLARGAGWLLSMLTSGGMAVNIIASVLLGLIIGAAVVKLLEVTGALDAIYNAGDRIRRDNAEWFKSVYDNAGTLQNILNGIADTMNSVLGTSFMTKSKMSELISAGTYNAEVIDRLRGKYGLGVSFGAEKGYTVGGRKLTEFQEGGVVRETGVALVHKGETVTPAGAGGVTLIINGTLFRDQEQLYREIADRLRREQWRHNA